jgi:hypothetical protein
LILSSTFSCNLLKKSAYSYKLSSKSALQGPIIRIFLLLFQEIISFNSCLEFSVKAFAFSLKGIFVFKTLGAKSSQINFFMYLKS